MSVTGKPLPDMSPTQPDTLDDSMLDETEIFISKAKIREAINGATIKVPDPDGGDDWFESINPAKLRQSLLGGDNV